MKKLTFFVSSVLCLLMATSGFALEHCKYQRIFVPALCNHWPEGLSYTRLVIRNVDQYNNINLTSLDFFDPNGVLVHSFDLTGKETLVPRQSVSFLLDSSSPLCSGSQFDRNSGRPSFIVKWRSREWVLPPIVQAIMGKAGVFGSGLGNAHSETGTDGVVIGGFCWDR